MPVMSTTTTMNASRRRTRKRSRKSASLDRKLIRRFFRDLGSFLGWVLTRVVFPLAVALLLAMLMPNHALADTTAGDAGATDTTGTTDAASSTDKTDAGIANNTVGTANQADEWYFLNFITLSREDPIMTTEGGEPYEYGEIDLIVTVSYANDVLARLDKEFTSRDKYTQIRVETEGDFLWVDPTTSVGETYTKFIYTFTLANDREAALWIVEDIHRNATQAALEIKAITPDGAELTAIERGKFHSELKQVGKNHYLIPDATVEEDYTSKEGIPNAQLLLEVAPPPGEEPPADEEVPPVDWFGGGGDTPTTPSGSTEDRGGVINTGDIVPLVCGFAIGICSTIIVLGWKRRRAQEA